MQCFSAISYCYIILLINLGPGQLPNTVTIIAFFRSIVYKNLF